MIVEASPMTAQIVFGVPTEWASCGRLSVDVTCDGPSLHARASWLGTKGAIAMGELRGGGHSLVVEILGDPARTVALRIGGKSATLTYDRALLGFLPYALNAEAMSLEVRQGSVDIEQAEVGAPSWPIVAVGDSQIHQGLVLEGLRTRGAPSIVNAGRAGGDTSMAIARFESDALKTGARTALLWMGSNDMEYAKRRGGEYRDGIATARENLDAMMRRLVARDVRIGMMGALPRAGLTEILELNGVLEELAAEHDARWWNPYEVLHARGGKLDMRLSDGLHPNADGAEKLAEWLAGQGVVEWMIRST